MLPAACSNITYDPMLSAVMLIQDEEETSIFNMGIGLDAAGTDAVFNFGNSNPAGSTGSTFTTHQQQQAEQEQAEKRLSQMQVNDLSAAANAVSGDMVWLCTITYSCLFQSACSTPHLSF